MEFLLGLLKQPAAYNVSQNSEKPDYTLAIVGAVSLLVIAIIFISIRRK